MSWNNKPCYCNSVTVWGFYGNELERRQVYEIKLEQYMSCEKSVLRSESEEVLAELQENLPLPSSVSVHKKTTTTAAIALS
jgi:hypothetical protein